MKARSWCGEELPRHGAAVAVIASSLYRREWIVVARRHALPTWLLTLAAAAHDAGKALPCYQAALEAACESGSNPSFAMHEAASAYAILAVPRLAPGPLGVWEASIVAAAAWLHHHGMGGRLIPPGLVAGLGRLRPCSGPSLAREASSPEGLAAMLESVIEACRLAIEHLGGSSCSGALLDQLARASTRAPEDPRSIPSWLEVFGGAGRGLYGSVPEDPPRGYEGRRGSYIAASSFLAGVVSLSDTLAAQASRRGLEALRAPGGYAGRVLSENRSKLEALQGIEPLLAALLA